MVRSRSLVVSLLFSLGGLTVLCMVALASLTSANPNGSSIGIGMRFFISVASILGFITVIVIPFSVMIRMTQEREFGRDDLQYATPLRPRAFVDGKALCSAVLGAFSVFAALPFLLAAYLMRGVGLEWVGAVALFAVVAPAIISYVAILIGATRWTPAMKRAAFILLFYIIGSIFAVSSLGEALASANSQLLVPFFCILTFATTWYVRASAIRLLTPVNFNRDRPVRLSEAAIWFASLLFAGFMAFRPDGDELILFWVGFWVFFFGVRFLMSVSMPSGYSRRVRSEITGTAPRRALQYLVFNGGENGVVFHLLMGLATLAAAVALSAFAGFVTAASMTTLLAGQTGKILGVVAVFWFYLVFFALVCRALWSRFLVGRIRPMWIGLAAFSLFTLANAIPAILSAATSIKGTFGFFGNAVGTAYGLSKNNPQAVWRHLLFSLIAFAVALGLWLPTLLRSLRDFKPRNP